MKDDFKDRLENLRQKTEAIQPDKYMAQRARLSDEDKEIFDKVVEFYEYLGSKNKTFCLSIDFDNIFNDNVNDFYTLYRLIDVKDKSDVADYYDSIGRLSHNQFYFIKNLGILDKLIEFDLDFRLQTLQKVRKQEFDSSKEKL